MIIGIVLGVGIGIISTILFNRYKPVKKVINEEEIEKQKKIRKSFDELMQYDYMTALGGGKVE